MTPRNNLRFLGLMALSAAFAAPMAFAQNSGTSADPANPAAAQPATPASPADPAAPAKKTWSDLDINKDGSLDKNEAANIPSLQTVFDQADANADGALTGDEYKRYLASNGQDPAAQPGKPKQK
jgi:hypothetical protein